MTISPSGCEDGRPLAGPARCTSGYQCGLIGVADPRSTRQSHRYVAGFGQLECQKRKRNPAVVAMLLRSRKPVANPPLSLVDMMPR